MIGPRWRKILKDITSNPWRTLLVISTIGIGALAVGFVSTLYMRVLGDMDKDFQSVNPHSAIIYTTSFTEDLLPSLRKLSEVGEVEGRSSTTGIIVTANGKEVFLGILAMPPVEKMKIDKLSPAEPTGSLALGEREILLERSVQPGLQLNEGDMLTVTMLDGVSRQLRIAGFVHDPTTIPYTFSNQASGYVTDKTLEWLDGTTDFNMLYLSVAEDKTSVPHVNAVASEVSKKIESSGRQVFATLVYEPGKHFAASITQALIGMMLFLGILVVLLSAILVGNTIDAVIGQQVRQIGMMKAVGASAGQITGLYLMLVIFYGILALVVAIPVGAWAANFIGDGFAEYLNYRPGGFIFPTSTLVIQIIVALGIPVLATLVPVIARRPYDCARSHHHIRPGFRAFRTELVRSLAGTGARPAATVVALAAQHLPAQRTPGAHLICPRSGRHDVHRRLQPARFNERHHRRDPGICAVRCKHRFQPHVPH